MLPPDLTRISFAHIATSRDVELLRHAAGMCDLMGRTAWAEAIRESIDAIGDGFIDDDTPKES